MKQLKTTIDKAQVTSLCADAISELERAVRLFPEWPDVLHPNIEAVESELRKSRKLNDSKDRFTAHSIFGEEYLEFLEMALKGNAKWARIELVQAMAMLIRISCHLNDYVQHGATESTEVKS
jgi:hypothetical protein